MNPDVSPVDLAFSWVAAVSPVVFLLGIWLLGLSLLRDLRGAR